MEHSDSWIVTGYSMENSGLTPERLFFHRFDSFEFTVHVQAKPKVLKKTTKKTKLKEKPLIPAHI
jgi:hypothetical protein